MTDREKLRSGVSNAAWGYFFLNFNINLGPLNILPAFVGWFLFQTAIEKLSGERRELKLLLPLCGLLALWGLADWGLTIFGSGLSGRFLIADLLVCVAGLYFHFQFLTDLSALADTYQKEGGDLDYRLQRRRTAYVVLSTAADLLICLPLERMREGWTWLTYGAGLLCLIEAVIIMFNLFELRKCFDAETWDREE